jgi:hypothetical protein
MNAIKILLAALAALLVLGGLGIADDSTASASSVVSLAIPPEMSVTVAGAVPLTQSGDYADGTDSMTVSSTVAYSLAGLQDDVLTNGAHELGSGLDLVFDDGELSQVHVDDLTDTSVTTLITGNSASSDVHSLLYTQSLAGDTLYYGTYSATVTYTMTPA